jgi:hypothetical protein
MFQSKISRYYLQKLSELVVIAFVVAVTAYSFTNNASVADILYFMLLAGLGLYFREDKNLAIILFAVASTHGLGQIAFFIDFSPDSLFSKLVAYTLVLCSCYLLRCDKLAKFSLSLLFCILISEVYWWIIKYDDTPEIAYYAILLACNVVLRHLLLARSYSFNLWSRELKETSIDWVLYNLSGLSIIVVSAMTLEYIVRHMLNAQVVFVYYSYTNIMSLINAAILWVILNYALKKTALFKA